MKKDFYEKGIYVISNYIFSFLQNTFYFAICNFFLILFFIITGKIDGSFNLLVLFLCLIPLGPSISALYYSTSKLILEKDIYFASYFWNFYKSNFISILKTWIIELALVFVFIYDYQYFFINLNQKYFHIIFLALILIVIGISFYTLCISSLFNFKIKDIFLLAISYMIRKLPITIMKFIAIYLAYCLSNNVSLILLPFMPSAICLVFFCYDKNTIREIKDKFTLPTN